MESEENLFSRAAEMDEVCRKRQLLENQQNRGIIEQSFFIGGIIVEVIEDKINKKNELWGVQGAAELLGSRRENEIPEAKGAYSLRHEFPKLRQVSSGFSPMELTQALRHFKTICCSDCIFSRVCNSRSNPFRPKMTFFFYHHPTLYYLFL